MGYETRRELAGFGGIWWEGLYGVGLRGVANNLVRVRGNETMWAIFGRFDGRFETDAMSTMPG